MAPSEQRWFPLESNPSLMNDYVTKMGFATHSYHFVDVFSTEDWALEMIPQPVAAVIFLYPLTEKQLAFEKEQSSVADSSQQQSSSSKEDDIWFIKQRIGNACGTIGLLHSLMNVPPAIQDTSLLPNSWLSQFASDCPIPLDPVAKAERLETDTAIAKLHDAATSSEHNQTGRGNREDRVMTHFVAIVERGGKIYELDGRKSGPVCHGAASGSLLRDGCAVIQKFMARDPTELRFTILALAPRSDD